MICLVIGTSRDAAALMSSFDQFKQYTTRWCACYDRNGFWAKLKYESVNLSAAYCQDLTSSVAARSLGEIMEMDNGNGSGISHGTE